MSVSAKNEMERICDFLRQNGESNALKIAKELKLDKSTVNKHLYSLLESKQLNRSARNPPVWSLKEETITEIKPALKSEASCEDKTVIELLRSRGTDGLAASQIAKELKLPRKTVNKQLYSRLEKGEVHKSEDNLWTWCNENRNGNLQKEIKHGFPSCAQDFRPASYSGLSQNFDEITKLDQGGYGHVYRVKHKYDGNIYAVKIVNLTGKADSEVKVLARLDHPNIVRYHTCWTSSDNWTSNKDMSKASSSSVEVTFERSSSGQSDVTSDMESLDLTVESTFTTESSRSHSTHSSDPLNQMYLYIQMEFCEGGKLTEWIKTRNLTEKQRTLEIFSEIVSGVEYIHLNNLIHRDLKPDNILFGADGKVKIGDFGLVAALMNHNGEDIERSKRKGTPQYMSPEQENLRKYDEKTDIFPLGLIWFEMLWKLSTGMERAKLWPDLRNQRFPQGFCEKYPTENKFILKMLSQEPKDRPHAKEIKENLVTFFSLDQNPLSQRTI
ncbi:protein kinase containing Z-DNA binding domains isoform X2 [Myxocyprinus asiaticus]|uniref:protein kinase containing Z-DNA binding domains isoform X2 n=1 Tax=Myxocyprinus asiaticus TaxID=70543 RepID=UPI002221BBBF|nr:protein kinase containing Z-DNA binding domains isoform X2 [Myxocyprinus asiaticus]